MSEFTDGFLAGVKTILDMVQDDCNHVDGGMRESEEELLVRVSVLGHMRDRIAALNNEDVARLEEFTSRIKPLLGVMSTHWTMTHNKFRQLGLIDSEDKFSMLFKKGDA